jgi:hypothetical protein
MYKLGNCVTRLGGGRSINTDTVLGVKVEADLHINAEITKYLFVYLFIYCHLLEEQSNNTKSANDSIVSVPYF